MTPHSVSSVDDSKSKSKFGPRFDDESRRSSWAPSSCVDKVKAIRKRREQRRRQTKAQRAILQKEKGDGSAKTAKFKLAIRNYRENLRQRQIQQRERRQRQRRRHRDAERPRQRRGSDGNYYNDNDNDNDYDDQHGNNNLWRIPRGSDDCITVFVRKRPMNENDKAQKWFDVLTRISPTKLVVHQPGVSVDMTETLREHTFRLDGIFDEGATTNDVYNVVLRPLITRALRWDSNKNVLRNNYSNISSSSDNNNNRFRNDVLCFAYGQTGSGKTYTMSSVYRMALSQVFKAINEINKRKGEGLLSLTCFEIYNGQIYDLLSDRRKCVAREDKDGRVHVAGLRAIEANTVEEASKVLGYGVAARQTGSTKANQDASSRSHALFRIHVKLKVKPKSLEKETSYLHSTITMIDLAGSERGSERADSNRKVRQEAAEINKSLLALKECIRALSKRKKISTFGCIDRERQRDRHSHRERGLRENGIGAIHVPFRTSVLTHILQDSFTDPNSRVAVVVAVSPGSGSCDHTLNSLRYAARLKA